MTAFSNDSGFVAALDKVSSLVFLDNLQIILPASVAQKVACLFRNGEWVPGSIPGRNIPTFLTMVLEDHRLALGFFGVGLGLDALVSV